MKRVPFGCAHDLRALIRQLGGRESAPSAAIVDSRTLIATCETGDNVEQLAAMIDSELHVVKLEEAKRGFVLLPRRWAGCPGGGERSFAWANRFRRLDGFKDDERLPETAQGPHLLAFTCIMVKTHIQLILSS